MLQAKFDKIHRSNNDLKQIIQAKSKNSQIWITKPKNSQIWITKTKNSQIWIKKRSGKRRIHSGGGSRRSSSRMVAAAQIRRSGVRFQALLLVHGGGGSDLGVQLRFQCLDLLVAVAKVGLAVAKAWRRGRVLATLKETATCSRP